jgi:hypothetical protein
MMKTVAPDHRCGVQELFSFPVADSSPSSAAQRHLPGVVQVWQFFLTVERCVFDFV